MADYTSIKNIIQEVVRTNDLHEITGANLQMVLLGMINAVDSNNEDDYTLIRQSINTLAQYVDSADNTICSSIANLLNYVNAQDNDIRSEINSLANSLNSAKFGYNVSVFGLVAGVHTLATAVKNVPSEYRFGGQKITFKTDAGWVTYQNTSLTIGDYEDVDNWVLDSGTTVEGDVTITNNPDYEDLTQNEGGQLKFADKGYNAATYSGLGRVFLRKNIIDGVNTLTQAMMSYANTIYHIQYDYVLGEDITIPSDCILEFDGGSISGGGTDKDTITGNNTQIKAADVAIFKSGIIIEGTWVCPRIPSDWFGDITSDNRVKQLINLTSSDIYNNIILKENEYHVSITTNDTAAIVPKSNTKIELYGIITMTHNAFNNSYIIVIDDDTENIEISGDGEIVGYYLLSELGTGREWGHGIFIYEARNITIEGITFRNCSGDGIAVGRDGKNPSTNVLIDGCTFYECYRQGISVICVNGLIIKGNYIYNIFGGYSYAIDIEPNISNTTYNVIIENNIIKNKKGINVEPHSHYLTQDIVIKNNEIIYSKYHGVRIGLGESIIVANNSFTKVELSDTNPTDTDSTEYTPFAIETTRSDARGMMLFENNHISGKGADSLSSTWNLVNAKYGTFRNNRFLGHYAIFENCTLENNNILTYQVNTFNNCYLLHNTLNSQNGSLSFVITSGSSDFIGNIFIGTDKLLIAGLDGNGISANFEGNILKNVITRAFCRVNSGISADKLVFRNNNIDLSYSVIDMGNSSSISLKTIIPEVNNIGANRPTLNANYAGFEFFDTTIGKPIYWNGTAWVDATGTPV